jgi:hypothetical protein
MLILNVCFVFFYSLWHIHNQPGKQVDETTTVAPVLETESIMELLPPVVPPVRNTYANTKGLILEDSARFTETPSEVSAMPPPPPSQPPLELSNNSDQTVKSVIVEVKRGDNMQKRPNESRVHPTFEVNSNI